MFGGDEFARVTERYYWATLRKNDLEDTEEHRLLFSRGFYLGAQWSVRTSGELSPHIARFMEFIMWLTERESDE